MRNCEAWPEIGESTNPNAENEGRDQRNPAQAHWDRKPSDSQPGLSMVVDVRVRRRRKEHSRRAIQFLVSSQLDGRIAS